MKHGRTGYTNYRCRCPVCSNANREYKRQWYKRNRERELSRDRQWRIDNLEYVRRRDRDKNRQWRLRNPALKQLHNEKVRDTNFRSLEQAINNGTPWTAFDISVIMDNTLTALEVAYILGRSYRSVVNKRARLRCKER